MSHIAWNIIDVNELDGQIKVNFSTQDETKNATLVFNWSGDKDQLIEHINSTALSYHEAWKNNPMSLEIKTDLLNLSNFIDDAKAQIISESGGLSSTLVQEI